MKELAEGSVEWAIPWPCLHEFVAIVTHPRIYDPPTPTARALEQVDAWLGSPSLTVLTESEQHWSQLRSVITASQARIHDARIVALCRQHGVRELWSAGRDLNGYASLSVANPLAQQ
jgi:predicted nucleic acid-binding protein